MLVLSCISLAACKEGWSVWQLNIKVLWLLPFVVPFSSWEVDATSLRANVSSTGTRLSSSRIFSTLDCAIVESVLMLEVITYKQCMGKIRTMFLLLLRN